MIPVSHGSGLTEIANELPELPIESGFMPIALAKEIEKAQHVVKKENHDKNWLKEAAEAMDVDIDPSLSVWCLNRHVVLPELIFQAIGSRRCRPAFPY
jgi:hypothetical protein